TVAKGFQNRDLLALQSNKSADYDIQQEGGDPKKDHGQQKGHIGKLGEFFTDQIMRGLVFSRIGSLTTIGVQQKFDPVDHIFYTGTGRKSEGQVIEGSLHIVGRCQGAASHPHDAKSFGIWEQTTRLYLVEISR